MTLGTDYDETKIALLLEVFVKGFFFFSKEFLWLAMISLVSAIFMQIQRFVV